ncbi:MAG TPA: PQQ-binding-like beta-propeller repeat protein [Streptosporangiaceae bacterium]|jgi:hypothetical protein
MLRRRTAWLTAATIPALIMAVLPAATASAHASQLAAAQAPSASTHASASSAGSSLGLKVDSSLETQQGTALTTLLPGASGDYLRLDSLGSVAAATPGGRTLWRDTVNDLYTDWHMTVRGSNKYKGITPVPQVPVTRLPGNPLHTLTAQQNKETDMHPEVTGYLTGVTGPVVAVAETVGANLGAQSCVCGWQITVPGTHQEQGTFVTVLNARTGQYLYSELDPGAVTQLAISGGRLIVGDETGDPSTAGGIGAWRSVTTVHALAFTTAGEGLTARTAWTYSTGAPWATLLGMEPAGTGVAVAWTDTPEGLGQPGPPAGHVVLLSQNGTVSWNDATAGYPVQSGYDASRGLLVVAEQADPTASIGYTLAGLRVSDGSTAVSVPVTGVLPTALAIGAGTGGSTWYVGGVDTTMRQADGLNFGFSAGQVTAVDPGSGQVLWSTELKKQTKAASTQPFPVAVLAASPAATGGTVLVASGTGTNFTPTPAEPAQNTNDLRALSAATGSQQWDQTANVVDPLSVHLAGAAADPVLTGVTPDQDTISYDAATGAVIRATPLMGDMDAAVHTQIDGHSVVVVGSQSGGVWALDASDLSKVVWQAYVGGPVHQIALAQPAPGAAPLLVVAATNQVDVLDADTGQIRDYRDFPGQYVWNVAVGQLGSDPAAVVVATDRLTAFDAGTGAALWTWRAPVPAYFSDAAISGGVAVAEYQNQVAMFGQPTRMAAIGVGAQGKLAWSAPASTATTSRPVLWNGVLASPDIPGAGTTGVALAWQNSRGSQRVDVRDAVTGALLYSNTWASAGVLSMSVDPGVGVVAVGSGIFVVRPGKAAVYGESGAFGGITVDVHGQPAYLAAEDNLSVRSGASASDLFRKPSAISRLFMPGDLVATGAPGQVIALPEDEQAWYIVDGNEEGVLDWPSDALGQEGLDVVTVAGNPAAATAQAPALSTGATAAGAAATVTTGTATKTTTGTPASTAAGHDPSAASRPASITVTTPSRSGVAIMQPDLSVKVRRYAKDGHAVLTQAAPAGYSPATIRSYLGLTGDGAGQSVAIVDAYRDPDITADVNTFSQQYGLPPVCGTPGAGSGCFRFRVRAAHGTPVNTSWSLETSLDVEWIHAVAPKATIQLVEAHDPTFASMFSAVSTAAALNPDAVSMSWGDSLGEFSGETYYNRYCQLADSVCVAATGDLGHPGEYPAYNPSALAVGGTTLDLTPEGKVTSETSWGGSGGGLSYFEAKSPAQRGVTPGATRGIPDVSFDADPNTGVPVYDSAGYQGQAGWFLVGGTSVGAPVWSAILANADQLRAAAGKSRLTSAGGEADQAVYAATSALADITLGESNGACPSECVAHPGYDFITGLGSPRTGIDAAIAAAP